MLFSNISGDPGLPYCGRDPKNNKGDEFWNLDAAMEIRTALLSAMGHVYQKSLKRIIKQ